jgi:hypothetical protein
MRAGSDEREDRQPGNQANEEHRIVHPGCRANAIASTREPIALPRIIHE